MQKYLPLGIAAVAGAVGLATIGKRMRLFNGRNRSAHISQSEESYRNASKRILILGAGFGGLATALQLDKEIQDEDTVSVLVIDRNNDLLFTPLLWTVANGRANPNNAVVPIRNFQRGRKFHVLHAEVESIDLARKEVHTTADSRPYDTLVITLGSHTAMPNLPGLRQYAHPFHTPSDALELRNHLIDAIEAAHHTTDPQEREEWLTFVVGGAGDTGIELAAIIHDYITTGLFNEYPWLADAHFRVIVVGRPKRILPMSKASTSRLVQHVLEQEGIEIQTERAITGVTERTVETSKGTIPARTLFWAAGTTAPDVVRLLPVEHAHNSSIMVDNYLRIPGYPDVYVIGDSSWAYDSTTHLPVPGTAQAARQQGIYVGKTIGNELVHAPVEPYRYMMLGHLALLGRYTGVAEIGNLEISGISAWLLWHMAYLIRNPSWRKRVRLVIDWLVSGLFGREIGQLRLREEIPVGKRNPEYDRACNDIKAKTM